MTALVPTSEFDSLVQQLRDANVGLDAAVAQAKRMLGYGPDVVRAPGAAELEDEIEDVHVDAGDKLMLALGFEVVSFSQKKRAKVTPGIPDRRYYHRRRRLAVWWEAKQETGRQRAAQREFQLMAEACGEIYVLGTLEALKEWIVAAGVATREGDVFEPTPVVSPCPTLASP